MGSPLEFEGDRFWRNGFNASQVQLESGKFYRLIRHDEAEVHGVIVELNVELGGAQLIQLPVGITRYASSEMIVRLLANGEMGLGCSKDQPAWFQASYETGLLDNPIFTVLLQSSRSMCTDVSELTHLNFSRSTGRGLHFVWNRATVRNQPLASQPVADHLVGEH